jgi:hypothetical protein
LIVVFLPALLMKCGSIQPQSNPVTANNQAVEAKSSCDFSNFKPMKARANYGAPLVSVPKPDYPPEARSQGIHGTVVMLLLVNTRTGGVEQACSLDGNELLVPAAKEAALTVKFDPYSRWIQERFAYAEERISYHFAVQ